VVSRLATDTCAEVRRALVSLSDVMVELLGSERSQRVWLPVMERLIEVRVGVFLVHCCSNVSWSLAVTVCVAVWLSGCVAVPCRDVDCRVRRTTRLLCSTRPCGRWVQLPSTLRA
jgi:hypothetical protein